MKIKLFILCAAIVLVTGGIMSKGIRTHVISRTFNEMAIGGEDDRHDGFDPRVGSVDFSLSVIEEVNIAQGADHLAGYLYRPAGSPGIRKLVIFFSGSHGSNAAMAGPLAREYNLGGVAVLGVDYRGFGGSGNRLNGAAITEAVIYEDARAIYRYAVAGLGVKPDGVILYGFSLGGAAAAKLAADLAEEGVRPAGLVLHSSIRDMTHAAADTLSLPGPAALAAGWFGGILTGGSYNTAAHLRRLSRAAPDLPIQFRGGDAGAGDELSLSKTKLDTIGDFTRRSVLNGGGPHQLPGSK
ncbi:MAG: alpha/beta fold hydrolase, partial [Spirochaetaceae bacterium]|nr:alpha/beta fold hydrolase [Spirochaetaceae bacterium]